MLDTETLRNNLNKRIKEALDSNINEKSDSDEVKTLFAQKLSSAIADEIDSWIKTATITVEPGISVYTTGNAFSQTGKTISSGTGKIS